jgi:uncharacterized protein
VPGPLTPSSPPSRSQPPPPLLHFVELFNREEFWESHEVLEGPWRDRGSGFYHGLILYASAFVHVQRDNPHGIVSQLRKAERALKPYEPSYLGVDVEKIRRESRRLREAVEEAAAEPSGSASLGRPFPRIALAPDRVRGDEPELTV